MSLRGNIAVILELDVNALGRVILLRLEVRDFLDEFREEAVVDLGRRGGREGHGDDEGEAEECSLPAHYYEGSQNQATKNEADGNPLIIPNTPCSVTASGTMIRYDDRGMSVVIGLHNRLRQGCQMAKFDPFLSLDCARVEGVGAQSKERDQILPSGNLV